jgi:hypothetical protein
VLLTLTTAIVAITIVEYLIRTRVLSWL